MLWVTLLGSYEPWVPLALPVRYSDTSGALAKPVAHKIDLFDEVHSICSHHRTQFFRTGPGALAQKFPKTGNVPLSMNLDVSHCQNCRSEFLKRQVEGCSLPLFRRKASEGS